MIIIDKMIFVSKIDAYSGSYNGFLLDKKYWNLSTHRFRQNHPDRAAPVLHGETCRNARSERKGQCGSKNGLYGVGTTAWNHNPIRSNVCELERYKHQHH